MKKLLLTGLIVSMILPSLAQQKVSLNIKKGDQFNMTSEMTQEIKQSVMGMEMTVNMEIDMAMTLSVKDVSNDEITFTQAYTNMSVKMSSPMQGLDLTMDSNEPENEFNKPLKNLIGKEIDVKVNYKGEVLEVKGIDDLMKDLEGLEASGADLAQFLDKEAVEKNYQTMFPVEYGKAYNTGDTWEVDNSVGGDIEVKVKSTYEATDISKKTFIFEVDNFMKMEGIQEANGMEMEMDMSGNLTGTGSMNLKTGLMSSYVISGKISGTMFMEANDQMPMDMEIPMSITQSSTTTLK